MRNKPTQLPAIVAQRKSLAHSLRKRFRYKKNIYFNNLITQTHMSEKIIGIDLGTTNSAVSIMEGSTPKIINNRDGELTTPSIVAFLEKEKDEKGNYIPRVGLTAKNQAITNPARTIYSIKRFIGKSYAKLSEKEKKNMPYTVKSGKNNRIEVAIDKRTYTPEEISSFILREMKTVAEDYLGHPVKKAVITVPAYFKDAERQATKDAGRIAGLEVERIINEPTAAALAYGLDKKNKDMKIVVFDLGGGTFDISILELGDGLFDVKATNGDVHLGGDDFDQKIIDWIIEEFKKEHKIDLKEDPMALQRIKQEAEKAKKSLSTTTSYKVNLPFISSTLALEMEITRAKFEALIEPLVKRTIDPCIQALKDAKLSKKEIDEIILVGGSTRIPRIQQAVKEFFGKEASKSVNPDQAVALGAGIQGGVLTGEVKDVLLLDVIPASVGIETVGGIFTKLIEKNTTIPTKKSEVFSTAQDNQSDVNVMVYQGEREMAADNRFLGRFELSGIPPAARGIPKIEVTFDIDANGILNVSAKDKGTGKENTIRIEGASNLSSEEIAKMEKDAADNAKADRERREKAEKINQADSLIANTQRQLSEFGDKISPKNKEAIEEALEDLKKAFELKDLSQITEHSETLKKVWQKASTDIYEASQKENASQATNEAKESTDTNKGKFKDAEEVK